EREAFEQPLDVGIGAALGERFGEPGMPRAVLAAHLAQVRELALVVAREHVRSFGVRAAQSTRKRPGKRTQVRSRSARRGSAARRAWTWKSRRSASSPG